MSWDFEQIDPTVVIGVDRKGVVLHDGDAVQCFNSFAPGERPGTPANVRRGCPAVIRRGHRANGQPRLFVLYSDGSSTGCDPDDPIYGVEKK
jgi:hypothetical protein